MDPLLFLVQVIGNDVDLCEGPILNFCSLFMRCAVLDVIKVVIIRLHADLAVSVLLIWDGLKQSLIMPVLNIIVSFYRFLQIFVILPFSSFLNSAKVLINKLLLSFGQTGTVTIWSLKFEFVDVILLAQAYFGLSFCVYSAVEVAYGRSLAVFGLLDFFLGHGNLHETLSW